VSKVLTGPRAEATVLTLILVVVACSAGWASFTHVHDWTMRHAPAGTPNAFGWVNAVISELVPVAAFLTLRQRRRAHAPIGYPLALLIAAAALSLAAQLAVAQPSPSGWLLSAVPALAFMALIKLVFTNPVPPATEDSAPAAVKVTPTPTPPLVAPVPAVAVPVVTKAPVKRVTPRPASADRVARVAARMPGASAAVIAAKAGVSLSTARRHLAALRVADASPSASLPAKTRTLTAA
jgi:hypothetical protein